MKLVFLGTAGYHPSRHRQTMCLMLPEIGVVLDAGTGMFRVREHLATPELDIFLTHAHLDHVVGLTYLFDVAYGKDLRRVTVHALAEKLAAVTGHLLAEALFPVPLPCDWQPLTAPVPVGQEGRLSYFPVQHPGGAIGFRLDWPRRSMAYVTDTTAAPRASYVDAIRGVDLLVHECNFPDGWETFAEQTGHSCTTPVAQVAREAGVRRLILAHVNPLLDHEDPVGLEQARSVFPDTELATDELETEF